MEIRTLRAFVEVVRQGGFSQAAKAVFATQSTVSKAVKQLEDEIGVPLLDRIGHRSKLTAAGEIVYGRAQRILAERDDLIAELGELRGLKRGTLRLGLLPVGSGTLFAPLFAIYRKRYPGIDIRLVEYGSERLWEVLLSGEIELAASLLPRVGGLRMERRPARAPDRSVAGGPHALAPPVRRPSRLAGAAVHSVRIRICTQPYHSGRLSPTRLRADCRRAQQPD
jgi:DNA-binding transcriptional LysR family regulator